MARRAAWRRRPLREWGKWEQERTHHEEPAAPNFEHLIAQEGMAVLQPVPPLIRSSSFSVSFSTTVFLILSLTLDFGFSVFFFFPICPRQMSSRQKCLSSKGSVSGSRSDRYPVTFVCYITHQSGRQSQDGIPGAQAALMIVSLAGLLGSHVIEKI